MVSQVNFVNAKENFTHADATISIPELSSFNFVKLLANLKVAVRSDRKEM